MALGGNSAGAEAAGNSSWWPSSAAPTSPNASLPAKFALPETTGRSWPQGYLSGLPAPAARATNSHSASVGSRYPLVTGTMSVKLLVPSSPGVLAAYAGGRPSCDDSQLQNSAASSQ